MGTIRFRDLVKSAGMPEIKSLWSDPKRDPDFMRAAKEGRVLTIVQEPGSKKKDFGEVGFHQRTHASYVVFPKRLSADEGNKVVGIKYDLVEESEPPDTLSPEQLKKGRAPKETTGREPVKQARKEKTFNVRVRRVAVLESVLSIEAGSAKEAKQRAIRQAETASFDSSNARIRTDAIGIKVADS